MLKVYFPNLNGIRFIAAFFVVIHHVEQFKVLLGVKRNLFYLPFIHNVGHLGVVLFFALSGFLITYLLLEEEHQNGKISIRNFYIRRILRIWPLYFLIIFLGFFFFSHIQSFYLLNLSQEIFNNFYLKLITFLLFLPNLALVLFLPIPYISQTWSVGVEEQFYLLWPALIRKFKKRSILLFSIIGIYLVVKLALIFSTKKFHLQFPFLAFILSFWNVFNIDCMAIGGLMAALLHKRHSLLSFFFNKLVQILVCLSLIILLGFGIQFPLINDEIYALLFSILIINLSANNKSLISLDNPIFNYLGKISYSIYMFHPIAIFIILKLVIHIGWNSIILQHLFCLLLTICIATISYNFFETPFLKRKIKFSKILSGDNAK